MPPNLAQSEQLSSRFFVEGCRADRAAIGVLVVQIEPRYIDVPTTCRAVHLLAEIFRHCELISVPLRGSLFGDGSGIGAVEDALTLSARAVVVVVVRFMPAFANEVVASHRDSYTARRSPAGGS